MLDFSTIATRNLFIIPSNQGCVKQIAFAGTNAVCCEAFCEFSALMSGVFVTHSFTPARRANVSSWLFNLVAATRMIGMRLR